MLKKGYDGTICMLGCPTTRMDDTSWAYCRYGMSCRIIYPATMLSKVLTVKWLQPEEGRPWHTVRRRRRPHDHSSYGHMWCCQHYYTINTVNACIAAPAVNGLLSSSKTVGHLSTVLTSARGSFERASPKEPCVSRV